MRILFVDDEARRMRVYVEELEDARNDVVFEDNVDSALTLLSDESEHFDVVVIDISMSTGAAYKFEDTDGGTRTGFALYDTIRRSRPLQKVVVFTNVSDRSVAERFANQDRKLTLFVRKPDKLPYQFAELLIEFVRDGGH